MASTVQVQVCAEVWKWPKSMKQLLYSESPFYLWGMASFWESSLFSSITSSSLSCFALSSGAVGYRDVPRDTSPAWRGSRDCTSACKPCGGRIIFLNFCLLICWKYVQYVFHLFNLPANPVSHSGAWFYQQTDHGSLVWMLTHFSPDRKQSWSDPSHTWNKVIGTPMSYSWISRLRFQST